MFNLTKTEQERARQAYKKDLQARIDCLTQDTQADVLQSLMRLDAAKGFRHDEHAAVLAGGAPSEAYLTAVADHFSVPVAAIQARADSDDPPEAPAVPPAPTQPPSPDMKPVMDRIDRLEASNKDLLQKIAARVDGIEGQPHARLAEQVSVILHGDASHAARLAKLSAPDLAALAKNAQPRLDALRVEPVKRGDDASGVVANAKGHLTVTDWDVIAPGVKDLAPMMGRRA